MIRKSFLFIIITIILVGCSHNKELPYLDTSKTLDEKVIDYEIEKLVLSKGFQSTEPMIEAIKEGKNIKLIVTTGIIECSGITIDKVTKAGNTINLYISGLFEKDKIQLAIPQVTVLIEEPIDVNIENLNFNIVSQNYNTISLKYNKNQIIDKIRTEFNVESNTIPQAELTKIGDKIQWNILFTNLIHKENSKSPLSNLDVKVDAITGEVIDFQKDTISTFIDEGHLMDYMANKFIIYKKMHTDNDIQYESLWLYDINNGSKVKIYTTKYKIQNAYFNPTGEYISLIEKDDVKSDIYIVELSKNIAYKITPPEYFHSNLIRWKDKEQLSIADISNEATTIFTYDIKENKLKKDFKTDILISSFDVLDNMIVFTESDELAINKNIFLREDGKDLEQIGSGYKPAFFDNKNIMYLENDEDINKNILKMYNIEKNSIMDILDYNIVNYYKLDAENILFVENTNFNNEYKLVKYHLGSRAISAAYMVNSPTLFYNSGEEEAYLSLSISSNDKSINNIYCIDLDKISIPN